VPATAVLEGALEGFSRSSFTALGKTRDLYRTGSGPAVLVMSEIPGITPLVASFARRVASIGCTAVLPQLFGVPGAEPTPWLMARTVAGACISREFSTFALTTHEPGHRLAASPGPRRARGLWRPGVGAVGMCITGGFALAMTVEEVVLAPVLSQPALPFPLNRAHRRDLGISDEDLARVRGRCRTGNVSVLGLRFSGDKAVPPQRFARLREELGTPLSRSRSTRDPATRRATEKVPTRC